ncbi:SSI family serine proteinase inhibitor [Streptosporangium sp. NPDC048865]|uniref:SSI family serine proteinase inhibitor n=1 Tax=Streptosporangium sp. NPDC048865 TaxID=3155766 RepID=UPI003443E4FA
MRRRLLCLAVAGLFQLSGTAVASAAPPPLDPGPGWQEETRPSPRSAEPGPRVTRPLPLPFHPGGPAPGVRGPAEPFPDVRPPYNARALVLSLARGSKPLPVAGHALLLCDRPGGTHPDAVRACEALAEVRGDPARLRPRTGVACTLQYDPVTVTASGIWNSRFIRFERTYGNSCALRAATGGIFALEGDPRGPGGDWNVSDEVTTLPGTPSGPPPRTPSGTVRRPGF